MRQLYKPVPYSLADDDRLRESSLLLRILHRRMRAVAILVSHACKVVHFRNPLYPCTLDFRQTLECRRTIGPCLQTCRPSACMQLEPPEDVGTVRSLEMLWHSFAFSGGGDSPSQDDLWMTRFPSSLTGRSDMRPSLDRRLYPSKVQC